MRVLISKLGLLCIIGMPDMNSVCFNIVHHPLRDVGDIPDAAEELPGDDDKALFPQGREAGEVIVTSGKRMQSCCFLNL
jgi:hypothetical protein